jgi:WD repeat-containing protein 23
VLFELPKISLLAHLQSVASHLKEPFNLQEIHDGLDFSVDDYDPEFTIFSVKFSNDGRELVAASSNNSIYVYDLEARKLSLRIPAHTV